MVLSHTHYVILQILQKLLHYNIVFAWSKIFGGPKSIFLFSSLLKKLNHVYQNDSFPFFLAKEMKADLLIKAN